MCVAKSLMNIWLNLLDFDASTIGLGGSNTPSVTAVNGENPDSFGNVLTPRRTMGSAVNQFLLLAFIAVLSVLGVLSTIPLPCG